MLNPEALKRSGKKKQRRWSPVLYIPFKALHGGDGVGKRSIGINEILLLFGGNRVFELGQQDVLNHRSHGEFRSAGFKECEEKAECRQTDKVSGKQQMCI